MPRPVLRIDSHKHTRFPSLTAALLGGDPQTFDATIEDAEHGEILAQPDWERRVWVCTVPGKRRVAIENRSAA